MAPARYGAVSLASRIRSMLPSGLARGDDHERRDGHGGYEGYGAARSRPQGWATDPTPGTSGFLPGVPTAARQARLVPGPLARSRTHEEVCVTGLLVSVSGAGARYGPAMEAVLDDGSGRVTLVWLGRREIRAVERGRRIRALGRLADWKGRRVIYNPAYELLPADR